jgi:hypothetical protein
MRFVLGLASNATGTSKERSKTHRKDAEGAEPFGPAVDFAVVGAPACCARDAYRRRPRARTLRGRRTSSPPLVLPS